MTHTVISADFTKQFHQDFIPFSGTEKRFQNLLFRQYAGNKKEPIIWGKLLLNKIDDEKIISAFIAKLKTKDMLITDQLLEFMHKFEKRMRSYQRKKSCTQDYYESLHTCLVDCSCLVSSFKDKIQQRLLDKLSWLNQREAWPGSNRSFSSTELAIVEDGSKRFSLGLVRCFDSFIDLLDQESANSKGRRVTSIIEEMLLQLLVIIEKMMMTTNATRLQLEKWQNALVTRETQEFYN